MTDRGGYDGVFYAFVLALDRHSQTRSGMGLSVLIGGRAATPTIALIPFGIRRWDAGIGALVASTGGVGRDGRWVWCKTSGLSETWVSEAPPCCSTGRQTEAVHRSRCSGALQWVNWRAVGAVVPVAPYRFVVRW